MTGIAGLRHVDLDAKTLVCWLKPTVLPQLHFLKPWLGIQNPKTSPFVMFHATH